LHPKLKELIALKLARQPAPQWEMPIEEVRSAFRALWTPAITGAPAAVAVVEDRSIGAPGRRIPLRLYCPTGASAWPVIVYLHGGGYVKGGIEESDAFCRNLAAASDHLVASVAYRLAPEHRFPAGLDDACVSASWAGREARALGARAGPVVLCGESAGGNLAAVVCQAARHGGAPTVAAQVLIQPVVDFTLALPSIAMPPEECLVPRTDLAWYYREYLGDGADPRDPRVSPLWASDLDDLPPTLVLAAEFDSLRDEAAAYARKLRAAGVNVAYTCWPGMIHGFLQMAGLVDDARRAIDEIATFLHTSAGS
jgi:acetyl esterase